MSSFARSPGAHLALGGGRGRWTSAPSPAEPWLNGHSIAAPIALSAAVLSGYAIPGLPYEASVGAISAAFLAAGGVLVSAVGGPASRHMTRAYWRFALIAFVVLVLAVWYAAGHGTREPWWMIQRYGLAADDEAIFHEGVLPFVPARGALDLDAIVTNAPLFWAAHVWVQRAAVELLGQPCVLPSLALNIVMGGLTASFSVGAAFFLASEGHRQHAAVWARRLVLVSPWLLASSVMFLRDAWIYAEFALALFIGGRLWSASMLRRMVTLALVAPPLTYGIYYLRREMVLPFVALLAMAAFVRYLARWRTLVFVLGVTLALGVLGANAAFSGIVELATARAERYQRNYLTEAASGASRNRGTVSGIVSGSLVTRGVVQTAWLPVAPLPKVSVASGSLYSAAGQAMPIWTIVCLVILWRGMRSSGTRSLGPAALLAWCGGLTVAVGFTSGESRHFYGIIPSVVISAALCLGTMDRVAAQRLVLHGTKIALCVLVASIVFTLLFFGPGVLLG